MSDVDRRAGGVAAAGAGSQTAAMAKQFEEKAREAKAVLSGLSDAEWKKTTQAEGWTVGVTAHHLAGGLEAVAGIVTTLAAGQAMGNFTTGMLEQMNAGHAREHADCTRAETIALFERGAAAAGAVLRGLRDDQLGRSGTVFADAPPMTVDQLIARGLLGHIDDHVGSIRKTIGR
jgi:Mycothiol maleylpyruvate isomerase N-terminal domain